MIPLLSIAALFVAFSILLSWRQRARWRKPINSRSETFDLEKPAPAPNANTPKRKHRITMGLKKLNEADWLVIDDQYEVRHSIRTSLFENQNAKVSQCLPEAKEACEEALTKVASFLCERYPDMFETGTSPNGTHYTNINTVELFVFDKSEFHVPPLEIAARLAMEDFTILMKNEEGQHYVAATSSAFLIGWSADERMGTSITDMHKPVPQWEKQVGYSVNKFMTRITAESPMERSSYFIQVIRPDDSWSSIYFQPDGLAQDHIIPTPERIIVRRERQSFVRLPKSGGILFTVRTTLTFLPELGLDELESLVEDIQSWPDSMADYKGRDFWGEAVVNYHKLRQQEEDVVV